MNNDTTEFQIVTDQELELVQGGLYETIAVDVLMLLLYCAIDGVSCY